MEGTFLIISNLEEDYNYEQNNQIFQSKQKESVHITNNYSLSFCTITTTKRDGKKQKRGRKRYKRNKRNNAKQQKHSTNKPLYLEPQYQKKN